MTQRKADDRVRLIQDIPELGLHRGDVGVVCSTWFEPSTAFDVEFRGVRLGGAVRVLVMPNQIQRDPKFSAN